VDFDEADWKDDALAFIGACRGLGVPAALEVSRSGNGAHAWIFFAGRVAARDARRLATAVISHTRLDDITFDVALSFAGEQRRYAAEVAEVLRHELGPDKVFYDLDYRAQLARPNLDVILQSIYRRRATLVVALLSKDYASKQWAGLEMRAIRDLVKHQGGDKVMFVRLDDAEVPGILSIDGHLDAAALHPRATAEFILQRLGARKNAPAFE
jgi:hypothetical protein